MHCCSVRCPEKTAAVAKRQARYDRLEREGSDEARRWCAFIGEAIDAGLVKCVGILLHMYSGDFESENIALTGRTRLRLVDTEASFLLSIEQGRLYEVVR